VPEQGVGPRRSLRVSASSSTRTKSTLTLHHNSAITSPTWASEASPEVGDEKAAGTPALKRKERVRIRDKMQTTVASRGTNFLQTMAAKPSRKRRDSVCMAGIHCRSQHAVDRPHSGVNPPVRTKLYDQSILCRKFCS